MIFAGLISHCYFYDPFLTCYVATPSYKCQLWGPESTCSALKRLITALRNFLAMGQVRLDSLLIIQLQRELSWQTMPLIDCQNHSFSPPKQCDPNNCLRSKFCMSWWLNVFLFVIFQYWIKPTDVKKYFFVRWLRTVGCN